MPTYVNREVTINDVQSYSTAAKGESNPSLSPAEWARAQTVWPRPIGATRPRGNA